MIAVTAEPGTDVLLRRAARLAFTANLSSSERAVVSSA
jgi:hypothetical protein